MDHHLAARAQDRRAVALARTTRGEADRVRHGPRANERVTNWRTRVVRALALAGWIGLAVEGSEVGSGAPMRKSPNLRRRCASQAGYEIPMSASPSIFGLRSRPPAAVRSPLLLVASASNFTRSANFRASAAATSSTADRAATAQDRTPAASTRHPPPCGALRRSPGCGSRLSNRPLSCVSASSILAAPLSAHSPHSTPPCLSHIRAADGRHHGGVSYRALCPPARRSFARRLRQSTLCPALPLTQ